MTNYQKTDLVMHIFQLGEKLSSAKRELDDILKVVLAWDPTPDAGYLAPKPVEPMAGSSVTLPNLTPIPGRVSLSGAEGSPPIPAWPLAEDEDGATRGSDVYYETRTPADLATPGTRVEHSYTAPDTD